MVHMLQWQTTVISVVWKLKEKKTNVAEIEDGPTLLPVWYLFEAVINW